MAAVSGFNLPGGVGDSDPEFFPVEPRRCDECEHWYEGVGGCGICAARLTGPGPRSAADAITREGDGAGCSDYENTRGDAHGCS